MADVIGEKNLAASVPEELIDPFWNTVPKGFKHKHVMSAVVKLWISLPEELRKQLIDAETVSSPTKGQDSFVEAVRQIARSEFEKLHRKAK